MDVGTAEVGLLQGGSRERADTGKRTLGRQSKTIVRDKRKQEEGIVMYGGATCPHIVSAVEISESCRPEQDKSAEEKKSIRSQHRCCRSTGSARLWLTEDVNGLYPNQEAAGRLYQGAPPAAHVERAVSAP